MCDIEIPSLRVTGQVKWFNTKAGFGFITVSDGFKETGKDIFVHYSSISVTGSQYKYLTQGEYVDFDIVKPSNDKHEFHAVNVTGIRNGNIMCETKRVFDYKHSDSKSIEKEDKEEYALVQRKKSRPSSAKPTVTPVVIKPSYKKKLLSTTAVSV